MSPADVFAKWLRVAFELCSRELTDGILFVYIEAVKSDFEGAILALKSMLPGLKPGKLPSAAEILERMGKVTEPLSDETQARYICGLIGTAITKFGWPSPKEAKAHIGDIGWKVVQQFGGWTSVCDVTTDNLQFASPQWREAIKTEIIRAKFHNDQETLGGSNTKLLIAELTSAVTKI